MERIGVRELRQNASVYVKRVQLGERFQVTDRGTPVAELGPVTESAYDRMVHEGVIVPAKVRFDAGAFAPVESRPGEPTASEALQAMRDGGAILSAYVDTSALAKLIAVESETASFLRWAAGVDRLLTSRIGVIELTRVARRIGGAEQALERVLDRLDVLPLTEQRLRAAADLPPTGLCTLDAIHLASALSISEVTKQFACYDDRLATAASAAGLDVVRPGHAN